MYFKTKIFRHPLVLLLLWVTSLSCATQRPAILKPPSKLSQARAKANLQKARQLLLNTSDYAEAKEELDLSLSKDPLNIRSLFWAAWTEASVLQNTQAFEHLLMAAQQRDATSQLAIWSAYDSIDNRSQAVELQHVLTKVGNDDKAPALVRARAIHFLGHVLRYLGKFKESSTTFSKLGYVQQWMLIGPFDNDQNSGFDTAYGPETEVLDLGKSYKGKQREVSWTKVTHFSFDARVSLSAIMDPSQWTAAYLATWIHSDPAQQAVFRLSAFRGVKLWLNNRLLLADDKARNPAMDQYAVGARLNKGWNLLLVKVCQRKGMWQLGLRVTDLEGNKKDGLRFDSSFHPTKNMADDKSDLPKPVTLLSQLDSYQNDPWSAMVRILWLTRLGFFPKAIEEAETMASAYRRSAMAQVFLARLYLKEGRDTKAMKALDQAIKACPDLPQVIFEHEKYEQDRKRYARAMEYLQPLLKKMPDNPTVRASYIFLLAARAWHPEALLEAQRFCASHPDNPWAWTFVGSELYQLNRYPQAVKAFKKALELRANSKHTYDQLIKLAIARGDLTSALGLAVRRTKLFPHLISAALQEAKINIAAAKLEEALSVCSRLEKIAPYYWLIHKIRGDILMLLGQRKNAVSSYSKSLDCAPDNPFLQEYMDHLEVRKDTVFEKYALGQEKIEAILSSAPARSFHPEADAVLLLDDQISHVFKDGFARHKVRQIYWIRTQRAQQRLSKFRVPSTSSFRLEVAQTILPDGSRQDATSIRTGVIHLPSIQPGAMIHVAYEYTSQSKTWMQDHYAESFYFQSRNPVAFSRWVLALPSERKLHIKVVGDVVSHLKKKLGDDQVHIWNAKNVPMIHSDLARPPLRELAAAVYVSTIPDWDTVAQWEASLIQDQFSTDESIRKKTRELLKGKVGKLQKMEALYGFVVQQVRYLYHDVGIFGKKPNQAANVFANRYGDCKDKSTLLIAMLRYAGIQADYSAIRTRKKGPVFWDVPCAQTNHAITYIPAQPGIEHEMFIDPTASYFNMYTLPEQDQGVDALVITKDAYKIIRTPVQTEKSNLFDYELQASINAQDPDASVDLTGKITWTGWAGAKHRQLLRAEGKREERFSNELAYLYPGAMLEQVTFSGLEDLTKAASAKFTAQIPGMVRTEGNTLRIRPLWSSKALRLYSQRPQRHYDIFLGFTMNQDARVKVAIPKGFKIVSVPVVEKIDTPVFSYSTGCEEKSAYIECRRHIVWHKRRLNKAKYPDFRKVCTKVSSLESRQIILEPVSPSSLRIPASQRLDSHKDQAARKNQGSGAR